MRLWTVHPRHLDAAGLVALWREGLLAQAVLLGRTRGYTRHPQLERFRNEADPVACIASYLHGVADEATSRGYAFDTTRIVARDAPVRRIPETKGQLLYEWAHLGNKLRRRARIVCSALSRGEFAVGSAKPTNRLQHTDDGCCDAVPRDRRVGHARF